MTRFFTFLVSLLPYIFVFIASLYRPIDPDLGWHLKYGEYFFQHHQILRENIYSTMMPGYQWANGSWGTDILTYVIYHFGGFLGLTFASAAIVTLTFFFFAKAAKLTLIEQAIFFPFVILLENSVNTNSFRGQQINMVFLGILFLILSRYKSFSKLLFFVPLLFFVWANIHRESILGLGLFGLWTGCIVIKKYLTKKDKKNIFREGLFLTSVFILSFLATLINPYGIEIYTFALAHFHNTVLETINEYFPIFPFSLAWWLHMLVLLLLALTIVSLAVKKKLLEYLPVYILPLILLLLAFHFRRYAWSGYYLMIPVFPLLWQLVEKYVKNYAFFLAYVILLISIAYVGYIKMPFSQFTDMSWNNFYDNRSFLLTIESAEFLRDNKLTDNLFTFFNWGGFLIWNYPEIKPSIDGRMVLWKDKKGYSAYQEYFAYMSGEKNINDSHYDIVYIPLDRSMPLYQKLSSLISQGKWKVAYFDDDTGIIVRVKKDKAKLFY